MNYFDLHCDTIGHCAARGLDMLSEPLHVDIKNNPFNLYVQCFAVFVKDEIRGETGFLKTCESFEYFKKLEAENPGLIKKCETKEDIDYCREKGICAGIFTMEGGSGIGDDIRNMEKIRDMGVKIITLTWSGSTALGDGVFVKNPEGLTPFGKDVVSKMEEYGIMVDISHASDRLFFDTEKFAKKPFVATHSNSRAVCSHPRNLTDDEFKIIRDRGGLVGLNFYRDFLDNNPENADIESIVRHADHFLSLGGEDILCMGSDFDGSVMPHGIEGTKDVHKIREAFIKHGFGEELAEKICFKNAYDFLTQRL